MKQYNRWMSAATQTWQRQINKYWFNCKKNENIVIVPSNKNLGPAVIDTATYINRALKDHLLDTKNYRRLTESEADIHLQTLFHSILDITDRICDSLEEQMDPKQSTQRYFNRMYKCSTDETGACKKPEDMNHGTFYLMPKVHKTPCQTRPVGSQSGSLLEPLARWLDTQLQLVLPLCTSYFKDGRELQQALKQLKWVPADAKAMYVNIDTDHGLWVLHQWFDLHQKELPHNLATVHMLLETLELIMRNNLFTFGDTWWIQVSGTAMGTSPALLYATIYYLYHEETQLLPHWETFQLLLYVRYIDDALIIQRGNGVLFSAFTDAMNSFGEVGKRLEWEATEPGKSVAFLDFTIYFDADGNLATKTYQKGMNLYLCLPPTSAHTPSIFQGMVYGMIRRY